MTTIASLSTYDLADMMGADATQEEAFAMMGILSRECVVDTDDVSCDDWMAYLEEAVATVARESDPAPATIAEMLASSNI